MHAYHPYFCGATDESVVIKSQGRSGTLIEERAVQGEDNDYFPLAHLLGENCEHHMAEVTQVHSQNSPQASSSFAAVLCQLQLSPGKMFTY